MALPVCERRHNGGDGSCMSVNTVTGATSAVLTAHSSSSYVYLFCIEDHVLNEVIPGCSCLRICCQMCHIAFPCSLWERRLALLRDAVVNQVHTYTSPVLVKVKSSCDFQVSIKPEQLSMYLYNSDYDSP